MVPCKNCKKTWALNSLLCTACKDYYVNLIKKIQLNLTDSIVDKPHLYVYMLHQILKWRGILVKLKIKFDENNKLKIFTVLSLGGETLVVCDNTTP